MFEMTKEKEKDSTLSKLLGEKIDQSDLLLVSDDLKKNTLIVASLMKEYVLKNSDNEEDWEYETPIPLLSEAYYCVIQLKKQVELLLIDDKRFSLSKKTNIKSTEKVIFSAYVGSYSACKDELKRYYGIFLNSMEMN